MLVHLHSQTSKSAAKRKCFVHFHLQMRFSLSGVPFLHIWASKILLRTRQFFKILTCKRASRYSGVQFLDIETSKSGPSLRCFAHFDLQTRFSLQRRAICPHLYFKKWSEHGVFCTFWLANALLATAACHFSTSNSKRFKKWSEAGVFCAFWLQNALRATAACNFSFLLQTATSAPAALPRLLFDVDAADPQIIEKTQHFATSLTFRVSISSFFWLLRNCIFFLLTLLLFSVFFIFWLCFSALLFQLSILSEVGLPNFLWWLIWLYDCFLQRASAMMSAVARAVEGGVGRDG